MKRSELEQLVIDLMSEINYLRTENEKLKNEVTKTRELFLETIDKWQSTAEMLYNSNYPTSQSPR